jgi:hypothetical protein
MGHSTGGSSRCSFMAAFVPHGACLALRVGNGAIMKRCMHAHACILPRERAMGEKFHACPAGPGLLIENFMVGLGLSVL